MTINVLFRVRRCPQMIFRVRIVLHEGIVLVRQLLNSNLGVRLVATVSPQLITSQWRKRRRSMVFTMFWIR